MRSFAVILVAGTVVLAIHSSATSQDSAKKNSAKASGQAKPPENVPVPPKTGATAQPAAAPPVSADELAIRQTGDSFVAAFNRADAKAAADHYTPDAEYINEAGNLVRGRTAIEESLKEFFAKNTGAKLAMMIVSIRVVGPGVAVEDGLTSVTSQTNQQPAVARYTAVHVKTPAKWLVASVRDTALTTQRPHRQMLHQLDWMLGEWVHEGADAVVVFNCQSVDDGNFLVRSFTVKIGGQVAMRGSQRIGWDAHANKFRTWIFDSDGGHSEGYWHRDRDTWVLKAAGVTADGQPASSTSIYTFVNAHTMTFQSVDHEVAGNELPDGPKITIVRHAPRPE